MKFIYITNYSIFSDEEDYLSAIKRACDYNVWAIILREPQLNKDNYLRLARQVGDIRKMTKTHLFLHKYIDLFEQGIADGIHLNKYNGDLRQIIEYYRKYAIIGYSSHSLGELKKIYSFGLNYALLSPIFTVPHKRKAIGTGILRKCGVERKIFALGGINSENIGEIEETKIYGVAFTRAIKDTVFLKRIAACS